MPRSVAPLVGRAGEFAELLTNLDAAFGKADGDVPRAAVAIIGGDAGVGKTRLLSEMVTAATERGATVLVGHCVDLGDNPPPYLPFSEAFARLAADRPDLVDDLLAAHPVIARLLPGRGSLSPDDRLDRGHLFESVLAAFAQLAANAPLLVIVEDLHWADQATRDLLGFLYTRVDTERLAIVASYRSDDLHRRHPLRQTLAQWARLPAVTRIQLDPLPPADVRSLVSAIHPAPLGEADLVSIVNRADGNAFFAEELVAAAEQCADPQHLPWQLADLLLVRLDRLSDDAREVVRVAAVAGRRVPHDMLADVVGFAPDRLDIALRDAVDSNVLQFTPSGRGYTFRHALLGEAVYDDLLPGERVRLHAAYAAVLAGRPDRSRAELARHALASHDLETAYVASIAGRRRSDVGRRAARGAAPVRNCARPARPAGRAARQPGRARRLARRCRARGRAGLARPAAGEPGPGRTARRCARLRPRPPALRGGPRRRRQRVRGRVDGRRRRRAAADPARAEHVPRAGRRAVLPDQPHPRP